MAASTEGLSPDRGGFQRAAILAFAVLQILVTLLPSVGIGTPIGERSDSVRTIITPAGWAFAIWGPLFAGSVAYGLYQAAPGQRRNGLLDSVGWASAGAFLGNAVWALYTQFLDLNAGSAVIIVCTLLCLLTCYVRISKSGRGLSRGEQFLVALPLSALAAWLTAATIVNVAASLKFHGLRLDDFAPFAGAAIVFVGGIIAAAAIWRGRGNPWYALAFLWALAGIYGASRADVTMVAMAAVAAAILVLGAAALGLRRNSDWRRWVGAGAG
jgi:hypothetical protein